MIVNLKDAVDVSKYGGKATNLAHLINHGFSVPKGWAISHNNFTSEGKLKYADKLQIKSSKSYAVRSSATVEDAKDKSWAGQFETFLFVSPRDVINKVEKCHASETKRALAYASETGTDKDFKIAVIVQEMVDPLYAGVSFTKDPVSGSDVIISEYVYGAGEKLVSGTTTPDQFTWQRKDQKLESKKQIPFSTDELIKSCLEIEASFKDAPQDIEWVIDTKGKIWIVQSRAITTLDNTKQISGNELSKLYETQIAFTEWLEKIGHADAKAMRVENSYKRERLAKIADIIPFPFDRPVTFEATELTNRTVNLEKYLTEHGDELCALRLIPKKGIHAEILRNRGKSAKEAMKWYDKQKIDANKYTVEFVPHMEVNKWSTIFIVNKKGIFGEIISDGHYVLTQGFHGETIPHVFTYDFKKWSIEPSNPDALSYLKKITEYVMVKDRTKRIKLEKAVDAEFINSYIKGYYETVFSEETGTWFIDYSRTLGKNYDDYMPAQTKPTSSGLYGRVASATKDTIIGKVRIVDNPEGVSLQPDEILVCDMTSPDYIPLMLQAKAIVTNKGGILCHAAIVARELKKSCIVGTANATKILSNGDVITLNLLDGSIK